MLGAAAEVRERVTTTSGGADRDAELPFTSGAGDCDGAASFPCGSFETADPVAGAARKAEEPEDADSALSAATAICGSDSLAAASCTSATTKLRGFVNPLTDGSACDAEPPSLSPAGAGAADFAFSAAADVDLLAESISTGTAADAADATTGARDGSLNI